MGVATISIVAVVISLVFVARCVVIMVVQAVSDAKLIHCLGELQMEAAGQRQWTHVDEIQRLKKKICPACSFKAFLCRLLAVFAVRESEENAADSNSEVLGYSDLKTEYEKLQNRLNMIERKLRRSGS